MILQLLVSVVMIWSLPMGIIYWNMFVNFFFYPDTMDDMCYLYHGVKHNSKYCRERITQL